jgi:hypothetical protein
MSICGLSAAKDWPALNASKLPMAAIAALVFFVVMLL